MRRMPSRKATWSSWERLLIVYNPLIGATIELWSQVNGIVNKHRPRGVSRRSARRAHQLPGLPRGAAATRDDHAPAWPRAADRVVVQRPALENSPARWRRARAG